MKKLVLTGILTLSFILTACGNTTESDNLQANVERDVSISIEQEVKAVNMTTEATPVSENSSIVEEIESSEVIETEVVEPTETTIEESTVATTPEPEEDRLYDDSYYDENGNFNPYTDEVAAPYEGSSSNSVTIPDTSNVEYTLPYIVNGIDIRNGDNDGDGISDNHQNTWWNGVTWTSSNGIVLRVADGFELNPGHMNVYSVFIDGTEDLRPGSDFMLAYDEFTGRGYKTQISTSNLPDVVPVSTKQTSINPNYSSFVAYKEAFDPLWQKQNGSSMASLQPYNKNVDGTANGIGLLSMLGGSGYMWTMDYDAGSGIWILTISSNYTELIWDSIHNSIRMITPDADQVYTEIYNACYTSGTAFDQENVWIQFGSTYVMCIAEKNSGKVLFLIQ